jgi:hypothetical protein
MAIIPKKEFAFQQIYDSGGIRQSSTLNYKIPKARVPTLLFSKK